MFCTSSDPTWVNVIDLDGQRVRGLLRGRTVESRTLRRCRSLGREGECTGEIFATSAGPFSAASKSVATVFCAEKSQRILLASVFPYIHIYSSNPRSTPPLFSGTGLIFSIAQECVGVQAIHSGLPKNRGAARCLRRAIDSAVISSGFSVVVRRPDSVEPGITLCPRGRVGANASQRT